jgi:hypothetical protein
VYVVGHEAVGVYFHAVRGALPGEDFEVCAPVVRCEKHILPVVASLGDVVRDVLYDCSCFPWHNSDDINGMLFMSTAPRSGFAKTMAASVGV